MHVTALIVALVASLAAVAAAFYLLCYGGVRGPVDWLASPAAHHGSREQGRIALTFDDGPDPSRTGALLDALAELEVKATFFLVGARVDASPALTRRIAEDGHEIGNHTYHHRYLPLLGARAVGDEIAATDHAIADATGRAPTLVRPPWGGRGPWTVRALRRLGHRLVLWDVNSFDWKGAPAAEVAERVLARVQAGSVVLLHEARDGGEDTIAAVRLLVPALRARGFELTVASQVLAAA
jgi:peptidoglycan/xylan/chitin deacetylase (PgdA/CDA1 family)